MNVDKIAQDYIQELETKVDLLEAENEELRAENKMLRAQHIADTLQRKVLGHHGDDESVRGSQSVERHQRQGGGTIHEHVIVAGRYGSQGLPQAQLLVSYMRQALVGIG